jgi:hypothetical protein
MRHTVLGRVATLAATLSIAACADARGLLGPEASQGIAGLVMLGPLCPVVSVDDPCPDRPYQATIEIRDDRGRSLGEVRSGEDGRFRVGLEPGAYRLHPRSGDPLPWAPDYDVVVRTDAYEEVTISFDTGIR